MSAAFFLPGFILPLHLVFTAATQATVQVCDASKAAAGNCCRVHNSFGFIGLQQ
jgi:hypothetical protein